MKHNVTVLQGALLDAAVAKAKGEEYGAAYCTDWSHGGPIIDRERICILQYDDIPNYAVAYVGADVAGGAIIGHRAFADGSTPLIAAMRAYVVSKLGEEVELPDRTSAVHSRPTVL